MESIPLATNFLAGSLITLLMPVGLLIALVVWYSIAVKRVPDDPSKASPHAAGVADTPVGPAAPPAESPPTAP